MISEEAIRIRGVKALVTSLGRVDAERFIASIVKEPFDVIHWQGSLFDDLYVPDPSELGAENYKQIDLSAVEAILKQS